MNTQSYRYLFLPYYNESGEYVQDVRRTGQDIIHNPLLNKGTAFTKEEREEFGIDGLLPPHVSTIEQQLSRLRENYDHKTDDIERYIFLRSLQDRNETLFYAFLRKYIHEMLPIIYTPTVGDAVKKYAHIYRFTRGLFISPENVDRLEELIQTIPSPDIKIIVATDSEGILGIGDQGVGGMAIPIGKLSIYTTAAGIHPSQTLPITLDVGTDNEERRNDPLYLGRKEKRMRGEAYDAFIAKFVEGVHRAFPEAILQWEDFSKQNAFTNMDKFREVHPSFNDDIEGTAAVTLGGILTALKIKEESMAEQKVCIYGAGAAGIGIARQMLDALVHDGLTVEDARRRIYIVDSQGMILSERENLDEYKKDFAHPREHIAFWELADPRKITLHEVVKNAKITVLIGVSAQKDSFNEALIRQMMKNNKRPIIFPLSNPTSKAEADPAWILQLTDGQAFVASGSPFEGVTIKGKRYEIGQGNNAFIFPGIGLGAIASRARVISPELFTTAAHALAEMVSAERLAVGSLYPDTEELFEVSMHVALAVYHRAIELGTGKAFHDDKTPEEYIRSLMWIPRYPRYRKVES